MRGMSGAYLLLEDGTRFEGEGAGALTVALGEAVFTTGMTGYQETLTDPSFAGQIITFSAPMIGNYGVEADVGESDRVQAIGMVCREARNAAPTGRMGLLDWLAEHGVPVLFGIDTRALVQHLRDRGAMRAALVTDGTPVEQAAQLIAETPEMTGQDLTGIVSRPRREQGPPIGTTRCTVVLLDYGAKDSIVDLVAAAGAHVVVVPHDATADDVSAIDPDGILLANGPGDPGVMDAHVAGVQGMLELGVPLFGICLGHQLLARALGLETYKLRFGHRGANHPVLETETGRVLVTSQNHGFAVSPPTGGRVKVTHVSLYDQTVEGLRLEGRPVWSMQFHPEASPGPHDAREALVRFVDEAAAYHDRRRVVS